MGGGATVSGTAPGNGVTGKPPKAPALAGSSRAESCGFPGGGNLATVPGPFNASRKIEPNSDVRMVDSLEPRDTVAEAGALEGFGAFGSETVDAATACMAVRLLAPWQVNANVRPGLPPATVRRTRLLGALKERL